MKTIKMAFKDITMRIVSILMCAALAIGGMQASAAKPDTSKAEARLAKALAGRVAGEPVDCLYLRDIRSSRIFDRTAILYETNGGKLYVNRPKSGASSLNSNDVMVTDTRSSQLCSIDVVRLYDSGARMQSGFVGLDEFVPYTKIK